MNFDSDQASITPVSQSYLKIDTTGALWLPTGDNSQRPGSPSTGFFRYNTDTPGLEYWNGTAWAAVGSGGGGGSFITLSDAPSSYTGKANWNVAVNSAGNGVTFAAPVYQPEPITFAITANELVFDPNILDTVGSTLDITGVLFTTKMNLNYGNGGTIFNVLPYDYVAITTAGFSTYLSVGDSVLITGTGTSFDGVYVLGSLASPAVVPLTRHPLYPVGYKLYQHTKFNLKYGRLQQLFSENSLSYSTFDENIANSEQPPFYSGSFNTTTDTFVLSAAYTDVTRIHRGLIGTPVIVYRNTSSATLPSPLTNGGVYFIKDIQWTGGSNDNTLVFGSNSVSLASDAELTTLVNFTTTGTNHTNNITASTIFRVFYPYASYIRGTCTIDVPHEEGADAVVPYYTLGTDQISRANVSTQVVIEDDTYSSPDSVVKSTIAQGMSQFVGTGGIGIGNKQWVGSGIGIGSFNNVYGDSPSSIGVGIGNVVTFDGIAVGSYNIAGYRQISIGSSTVAQLNSNDGYAGGSPLYTSSAVGLYAPTETISIGHGNIVRHGNSTVIGFQSSTWYAGSISIFTTSTQYAQPRSNRSIVGWYGTAFSFSSPTTLDFSCSGYDRAPIMVSNNSHSDWSGYINIRTIAPYSSDTKYLFKQWKVQFSLYCDHVGAITVTKLSCVLHGTSGDYDNVFRGARFVLVQGTFANQLNPYIQFPSAVTTTDVYGDAHLDVITYNNSGLGAMASAPMHKTYTGAGRTAARASMVANYLV